MNSQITSANANGVGLRTSEATFAAVSGSAAGIEWPEVIHQKWPPHTGAQQCCKCGGWIMGAQSFWTNNTGPMCPSCYKQQNDETERQSPGTTAACNKDAQET